MARPIQVKINLPNALKTVIGALDTIDERASLCVEIRAEVAALRQFSSHVDAVVRGEHTPAQLCQLYMIEGPPKPPKAKPVSVPPDTAKK